MEPEHDKELHEQIAARLKQLPQVVRDAITSADVEAHLRSLADSHQLHIDQWEILENEVMLTLMGFQRTEDLEKNIREGIDVKPEIAAELARDISEVVFAPIREELERQLEHPDAHAAQVSEIDAVRTQELGNSAQGAVATPSNIPATPQVQPATPPTPAPTEKAERAAISTTYTPQAPSHERKSVEGDPYREQLG